MYLLFLVWRVERHDDVNIMVIDKAPEINDCGRQRVLRDYVVHAWLQGLFRVIKRGFNHNVLYSYDR